MLRVRIITQLIHLNENLVFYPRLRRYYKQNVNNTRPVIIDVGANKGQTIDFFLGMFPESTIYAFEPNQRLFLLLSKKYKNNNNVKLFNCGVSNEKGKLLFHESILDETSTFEELNYDSEYLKTKSKVLGVKTSNIIKDSYEVEVISLSDFISLQNLGHIDILKIDTEGHEYKCLKGLFNEVSKFKIKIIQLEQHEDDMYLNKTSKDIIDDLLKLNKFHMHRKIKHGFGDFYEMLYKSDN